ncbi:MAG TPA: hypothetical protein VJK52_02745 [Candidatus Nanoarchaeia archaeon]|nr:hypothetical protein [Candidatus Nanoarchaeia archaeon]
MKLFSSQKSVNAFTAVFALLCILQSGHLLGAMGQLASVLP